MYIHAYICIYTYVCTGEFACSNVDHPDLDLEMSSGIYMYIHTYICIYIHMFIQASFLAAMFIIPIWISK